MVDRRRSTISGSAVSEMSIGSAAPVVVLLVKAKEVHVEADLAERAVHSHSPT
jgi:hypothetical protein